LCNVSKGCVYYGKLPFFTLLLKNCDISLGICKATIAALNPQLTVNHKTKQLHGRRIEMKMWSPLGICCGYINYSDIHIDGM